MTTDHSLVAIESLTHRYGERLALDEVSLTITGGQIFGLLGPNGGGKTTLFRVLSTLVKPQQGQVRIFGCDVVRQRTEIRRRIGVVFQSPSLDHKLSVKENLQHQGHLYGLRGGILRERMGLLLERFGLHDRQDARVETLSGGLRRRVELAKGLLHKPDLLLLDEPSTGLDPRARRDLMTYLQQLRDDDRVTVLLTTHLMEEADECDRLAILDGGRLVTCEAPDTLKAAIGGDVITVTTRAADDLRQRVVERFGVDAQVIDGTVRLEQSNGHAFVPKLVEAFPQEIEAVSVGKPNLEDVFIDLTGHRLEEGEPL